MKLHKFLLTPPIVAISAALFCGALFGATVKFTGGADGKGTAWAEDANWDTGLQPSAGDDVVIDGKTVVAQGALDVGSLTLKGAAKLTVRANELTDYSVFESVEKATAAIRDAACIVTITGNFEVGDTAVVYPEAAKLTGVPVFFRVGGNFTLAEGAKIDAHKRGWSWSSDWYANAPTPYARKRKNEGKYTEDFWTVAFGAGENYNGATTYNYVKTFAPFLPGSPTGDYYAGTHEKNNLNPDLGRGAGSIVIFANNGTMSIDGQIMANADNIPNNEGDGGRPTGGGIWLVAQDFAFGEKAKLMAEGGSPTSGNQFAVGAGGRIALAEGCDDAEVEAMLLGTLPDTLVEAPLIEGVEVSVAGGKKPNGTQASDGTLSFVRSSLVQASLVTLSTVDGLVAEGVTWGDSAILNGEQSFTAPELAYLKADSGVRYHCAGFVVSNATAEVASGEGRTAVWTSAGRDGPYSLTWKWDTREVRISLSVGDGGSVTWGENTYLEASEVWVPSGEEQTFTAATVSSAKFVAWTGKLAPDGYSLDPVVTFSATASSDLDAVFSSGSMTRVWVGPASGGNWKDKANWSPTGVPTIDDNVYLTNVTVSFTGAVAFNRLVAAGTSKLTFNANTIGGTEKLSFDEIYAGATKVLIVEDFEISGSAMVTAANDPMTGAAVCFEVGGNFFLGEKAKLTADETGFYWYKGSNDDPRKVGGEEGATKGTYITQAPGRGYDYNKGGGYGGAGGGTDSTYSKAYGYKYAPFLPGSPNGIYGGDANLGRAIHPGGTVWLQCAGNAVINGPITADSRQGKDVFGSASGGGIWILAANVSFGAGARLSARGGDSSGTSYGSGGGGGRISVGIGLSAAEIAAFAEGRETVDGVKTFDRVPVVPTDVTQGRKTDGTTWGGKSGTATLAVGSTVSLVAVDGVPKKATGVAPQYGLYGCAVGTPVTLTAEAYGYDPTDDSVRYAFDSFVVSNLTEQVDAGTDRSVTLTPNGEPQSLVWKWGAPQPTAVIRKPEHATMTVNGTPTETDVTVWVEPGAVFAVEITPETGYEFLNWTGDVPFGFEAANPANFAFAKTSVVTPVVRRAEEPTTRTWGGGTGEWNDPMAWTPQGNIPGPNDDVVIAGGICSVQNYFAVKSLAVSGGTLNVGTDKANSVRLAVSGDMAVSGGAVNFGLENFDGHFKADIGGDLALSGKAKLTVYGGVIDATYTHAMGASWVTVGGALTLDGTSELRPVSSAYTGGSVVFKADTVTVGATATVNANEAGYRWLSGTESSLAPGRGDSYTIGGGYGGAGNGANDTYGNTYGNAWAPTEPGSPNGNYSKSFDNCYKPGGLIRIHARTMAIFGTLTANAWIKTTGILYGGASGGGIWLTADKFDFGETAVLTAIGGNSCGNNGYWSQGGGGRIAVDTGLTADQIETLANGGKIRRKAYDEVAFTNAFVGASVDVKGGSECFFDPPIKGNKGTFVYLPDPPGLMLLVK